MLFLLAAFVISPALACAQEGEPVVVDEVIAQVNDGVVTLSQLKREMKERVDTLKQNGMTEQQANAEVQSHKAELISILISEQLLLQKGKELDYTEKVEAEVNKRMLETAKENNIQHGQAVRSDDAGGIELRGRASHPPHGNHEAGGVRG